MTPVARNKIVVSINTSWNVVNFRKGLIEALRSRGYDVVVIAPRDEYSSLIAAMGCRYVELDMDNSGTSPLRDLVLLWRYWRLLRRERPLAFVGFTIKPNVFGSIAANLNGIPVINNISGLGTAFVRGGLLLRIAKALYRVALARSKMVFFQNDDDRMLFVDERLVRKDRTALLPGSGIDLERFAPASEARIRSGAIVFLLVARLLWDKGVGEFIEAARLVRQEVPGVRFHLLGFLDVENRTAVSREQVEKWVGEGLVEYLGSTDDVRPFMRAADCVVLPSYREGTPRSLLEAAAMGKPLIATDVPGCREVVDHAVNGFLCKVRDPDDLASKMVEFARLDGSSRDRMGAQSRNKVERQFSETIVIEKYMRQIERLNALATK
ncbi:glycosyltransferase family 4 protein [Mesorhizobium sp. M7A.F.Ca.US.008.03.1.1]|uniref:glycosyltransferase family 4 protein n=1 Tax=Mesorhizobium sp. M7A.F.Ca.US.008.03.1.1 TaxID=2496742 RepID=UPI000FCC4CBB|nr:glycosyltransferase family 4 protein [Mesorhizobium sp. M7A.F.Ca.US.008.03.1.1]RUW62297.1 glycosyltransferase family 1 protein [Mesorhizobium sp. M7A.F.Ca.US.008.03.1.1]